MVCFFILLIISFVVQLFSLILSHFCFLLLLLVLLVLDPKNYCQDQSIIAQSVKNLPAIQETQVHSWVEKIPGEGNGNPLRCYCLENPMDRGAWQAAAHGVTRVRHDLATRERERECQGASSFCFLLGVYGIRSYV